MSKNDRRHFLKQFGTFAGCALLAPGARSAGLFPAFPHGGFKLGAISDGLSEDFEEALKIMKSYGLKWVEVRSIWGIYNTEASPAQIARVKELLGQFDFRVSAVATAFYKCTLPGTKPVDEEKDVYPYAGQMDLLQRAAERAQAWGTDKLRVFTFWRVAEPEKHYASIAEEMEKAGEFARGAGVRLVIENEGACNVGTGHELARFLKMVRSTNVGANWDVGNGLWHGEIPYPDGYDALDKSRIWHMHVKGVECDAGLKNCRETFADQGQIDLAGQFRALAHDGYDGTISLECEFETPGLNHQQTTRRSMEGLLKVVAREKT
ncbi:MAG: sugar phosphate isomerase/epimerase [Acidobacteriia bacterium]|nr:sugar phosphate isomerase/epimerase [Terriglobia bacterium]